MIADFVVVGSGPSGAMAAQTLAERGASVAMLDVGFRDEHYRDLIPDTDYLALRQSDAAQHRYLLGDSFEAVPWGGVGTAAQLTAPRKYIQQGVADLCPLVSSSFKPLESLAYGGLGAGWGLGCYVFNPRELEMIGLDPGEMQAAYQVVADRIGIAAGGEDVGLTGALQNTLSPIEIDEASSRIFRRYRQKRAGLNQSGFFLGETALALLTRDFDGRRATGYDEMEFYTDRHLSAYRPWMTLDRLQARQRLAYFSGRLVVSVSEEEQAVAIHCLQVATGQTEVLRARRVILACGALGTARIVLRSGRADALPILTNPYTYLTCLLPSLLGRRVGARRLAVSQLTLLQRATHETVTQLYTYRSLMLFRILKDIPLACADARALSVYLLPALVIAGVFHPGEAGAGRKTLRLRSDPSAPTGDALSVEYALGREEETDNRRREGQVRRALASLGCYPFKRFAPGHGASIHYGGTIPFSRNERAGALHPGGRLHGSARIFVADGSGFTYLPGKGLTLTLMANAHNVARSALDA